MSSSYGPIIRFKQLTRNIQNGFWQYYIRNGRSRAESRIRCACVVLVQSANTSNHEQRRGERGADFPVGFCWLLSVWLIFTRLEIKCTSAMCESLGRGSQILVAGVFDRIRFSRVPTCDVWSRQHRLQLSGKIAVHEAL